MPKMKSVKGAVKRFKVKKNGTIKRGSAFRSHILTKKTQKRKRNLRGPQTVHSTNVAGILSTLCKA
ncbi:50S ribosomal protein L35 [Aliarcobacter faecis]|uniref:50S ribosomal protein L35 n=1 Tax=Aliarcobacter faecis TaxID=1564138 RepID=UPI00047EAF40|nr:50S ribosomal protein L35 [Aliarcobacter faecis]QKF74252.1 50S ribosomal protein L35 [Aliarcobacter faecis]